MSGVRLALVCGALGVVLGALIGCRDNARYSTTIADHYEGTIVPGSFVRSGIAEKVQMCVSLDAERLQDAPGTLSTSDGRFLGARLRPIPQLWHDPLSTLSFGDGRRQNLVYVASPAPDAGDTQDVMVIMSLMETGGIEVRLMRGAPEADASASAASASRAPLFGVFALQRAGGACAF